MKDVNYALILPNVFKTIGLSVAILLSLLFSLLLVSEVGLSLSVRRVFISGIILGLILFVLARQKQEDEMTTRIRYVSIMHTFVIAVVIAVVVPLVALLSGKPIVMDYQGIILSMLIIYIIEFYWFIIKAKNEKHD